MPQAKPLILFAVLFLAFAVAFQSAIAAFGFTEKLAIGLMWSVGISAMAALKLSGLDLSSLGWSWGDWRYHLLAFIMPIVYGGIAYGLAGATGLATFPSAEALAALPASAGMQALSPALALTFIIFLAATSGMVGSMATALGEEIGWRGFLTPRLTALTGFVVATLITGLIWGGWHLPMLVFSDYNAGGDTRFEIASFMVMVVSGSGVYAWLRLQSGSLWPAVTLHASHNLFIQSIFDPLTVRGDHPITMVSEFGVVTAGVVLVLSLPFWVMGARRFRRVASAESNGAAR